ncbi:MAG: hypothetical protein QUS14_17525, partial [Pyrinomonadaceae bacterium]|nr:hypothetical protein [Pyrinomonadaceae bacterium]
MFDNRDSVSNAVQVQRIDPLHKALLAFGLVAPAVTFAIAVSALTIGQKTAILVSLAAVYAGICGTFIIRHRARAEAHRLEPETPDTMADDEIRDRLDALEEANEFFGSSLKAEDMFRLVASRVDEIFPFAAAMLLYPDGSAGELKTTYLTGKNEASLAETAAGITSGIAGISLASGNIEIDAELSAEKNARGEKPLEGFRSAAAIPLFHDGRPFAVFQLY